VGSEAKEETSQRQGDYKAEYARSWAVVIGINDYQYTTKLDYAVTDAVGIAEILVSRLGFPKDQVLAVLDPAPEEEDVPYRLVSPDASKTVIERLLFTTLPAKVGEDDRVLIFYAGHALPRPLPGGSKKGYLMPADGREEEWDTYITMESVIEAEELYWAKHMFYLIDACYSGLATTRSTGTRSRYETDMLTRKARQVLTAGNADQVIVDRGPDGHSLFTGYVLNGLRGGASQQDSDVITASDLMVHVKDRVGRHLGSKQTPDFGPLPGHQSGGDLVFKLPRAALAAEDYTKLGWYRNDLQVGTREIQMCVQNGKQAIQNGDIVSNYVLD